MDFRNRLITVRLTSEEFSLLGKHIEGLNVSISSFVRNILLREIKGGSVSKKQVGGNAPCPCGSGKKYKKCCMLKTS